MGRGVNPIRVLIADDDPVIRGTLERLLDAQPGFTVTATACDVGDTIARALATRPDVVLLDVRMPGGGGQRAAQMLRERAPGIATVALSAHEDATTVRTMLAAGVSGYAIKGGSLAELLDILRAAVGQPAGGASGTTVLPNRRLARVLVVVSDPAGLAALSDAISLDADLELVGLAQSPSHAVSLASRHHPDLVLLDPALPGGGGQRVINELRIAAPGARVVPLTSPHTVSAATIREALGRDVAAKAGPPGSVPDISHLRAIIEHDDLETLFQPVLDLTTRSIVGVEALTRFPVWPARSTEVWFAEAARMGLGLELELAAVDRALGHLDEIEDGLWMSVNLSPEHLMTDKVAAALTGPPPGRVMVEITEHAAVADYDALAARLKELRSAGVRFAVDDAGAGFASLRHIMLLTPDFIKLDGTLGRDVGADASRVAMTRALVSFAAETGSKVVAEGVERNEDAIALLELGVMYGQGFHFARPGPIDAVPA